MFDFGIVRVWRRGTRKTSPYYVAFHNGTNLVIYPSGTMYRPVTRHAF